MWMVGRSKLTTRCLRADCFHIAENGQSGARLPFSKKKASGGLALSFGDDFAKDAESAFDSFGADVAVGNEADGVGGGVECPDAVRPEGIAELDGVKASLLAIKNNDVGLNFAWVNAQARNLGDPRRETPGVLVVERKALGRLLEGHAAGGGKDADLSHASAKHLAVNAALFDETARAYDHGADGRAESFRKAEHHRVKIFCDGGNAYTECVGGVEDARTVEVNFQPGNVCLGADVVDTVDGISSAAGHIVGVFQT